VGTETDGAVRFAVSITYWSIKPTSACIPGQRIVPISHRQDTAGPMARRWRNARDSARRSGGAGRMARLSSSTGEGRAHRNRAGRLFGFNDHVDRPDRDRVATLKRWVRR